MACGSPRGLALPMAGQSKSVHPVLPPALEGLALLSCSCGAFLSGFASNTHCLWVELLGHIACIPQCWEQRAAQSPARNAAGRSPEQDVRLGEQHVQGGNSSSAATSSARCDASRTRDGPVVGTGCSFFPAFILMVLCHAAQRA